MGGKLIVIEGTDGSGKATQAKRLLERLQESGYKTEYLDFPQHGEKSCGMVDNYLNGKYGSSEQVDSKIASIFYAVDRYDASFAMRKALKEGKIVVCNRYISANMGHQGGKIHDAEQRKQYLDWLEELEFGLFNIPKPDMTILLYVPYEIAQTLIEKKEARNYIIEAKKDIHEKSKGHLLDAEKAYLEIADQKGWKVINCTSDDKILPVEEIHQKIWKEIDSTLKA
jgi:dTMP kinase